MIALSQIPATRISDGSRVLIIALDPARHQLVGRCFLIEADGSFGWAAIDDLKTGWTFDAEAGIWLSDVIDSEFIEEVLAEEADNETATDDSDDSGADSDSTPAV